MQQLISRAFSDTCKNRLQFLFLAPTLLLILFFFPARAQSPSPSSAQRSYAIDVYGLPSTSTDQTYILTILLPDGYQTSDKSYPVFYILDNEWNFGFVYDNYRALLQENKVPEMILVGVGYGSSVLGRGNNRDRDMGPSLKENQFNHASKFKDFFSNCLFNFIEDKYRVTNTRIIHGHSMGGLFLSYILFTDPTLFDRYIISSPSWWWGGRNYIFKQEELYYNKNKSLPAKVFLSMGGKDGPEMVNPWQRFVSKIAERNYKDLSLKTRLFKDKDHHTVMAIAVYDGLIELSK